MAARLKPQCQDHIRAQIQGTQLVKRLQKHAESDPKKPVMTDSQVRACNILLAKVLPDLKAIEHTGEIKTNAAIHLHFAGK